MSNNNQSINNLIKFYQTVIHMNKQLNANDEVANKINTSYQTLVEQLLIIEQLLIDKNVANINAIYRPLQKLFINEEHYGYLDQVIQFYKQNNNLNYPLCEVEHSNEIYDINDSRQSIRDKESDTITNQHYQDISSQLSLLEDKLNLINNKDTSQNQDAINNSQTQQIVSDLSNIKEILYKSNGEEFNQAVIKASNDTIATLNTNYELIKADITKYDNLVTYHINQTSQMIGEAIEKEHARFTQKIASDSNAIINGITESNASELEKQANLIQTGINQFDDKLFWYFVILFFTITFVMFGCSLLSARWAANKSLGEAKVFKIIEEIKQKPVGASHKIKYN